MVFNPLGSTSVMVNADGSGLQTQGYYPWGETRFGGVATEYQYTGQYRLASLGLDWYNSRWYDSSLGRFVQADTIVPEPGNTADFDRYSYVRNNPLKYTDPTGHCSGDPNDSTNPDKECWRLYNNMERWFPNVGLGDHSEWTVHELANLFSALAYTRKAFGGQQQFGRACGDFTVYGPASIQAGWVEAMGAPAMAPPGWQMIIITSSLFNHSDPVFYILHEIGHIFDAYNKGSSANYHSQAFVNKWGKGCAGSGWLGCSSHEWGIYPLGLTFMGYDAVKGSTTDYGLSSSIDDFADSFAGAVLKLNGFPKATPWDVISANRLQMLIGLITSY